MHDKEQVRKSKPALCDRTGSGQQRAQKIVMQPHRALAVHDGMLSCTGSAL